MPEAGRGNDRYEDEVERGNRGERKSRCWVVWRRAAKVIYANRTGGVRESRGNMTKEMTRSGRFRTQGTSGKDEQFNPNANDHLTRNPAYQGIRKGRVMYGGDKHTISRSWIWPSI